MMRNMINLIKTLFTTWQGWSEIWLTWFFGSYRTKKIAEKKQNESKLICLRSLFIYAIKDFLMFRNKIMFKRKYLKKL